MDASAEALEMLPAVFIFSLILERNAAAKKVLEPFGKADTASFSDLDWHLPVLALCPIGLMSRNATIFGIRNSEVFCPPTSDFNRAEGKGVQRWFEFWNCFDFYPRSMEEKEKRDLGVLEPLLKSAQKSITIGMVQLKSVTAIRTKLHWEKERDDKSTTWGSVHYIFSCSGQVMSLFSAQTF